MDALTAALKKSCADYGPKLASTHLLITKASAYLLLGRMFCLIPDISVKQLCRN